METTEKIAKVHHIKDSHRSGIYYEKMSVIENRAEAQKFVDEQMKKDKANADKLASWEYQNDITGISWIFYGSDYRREILVYFV